MQTLQNSNKNISTNSVFKKVLVDTQNPGETYPPARGWIWLVFFSFLDIVIPKDRDAVAQGSLLL